MAILDIYLDIDNEYINLIKDLYKILVIFIIFQLLVFSYGQKNIINLALNGNFLNDDFMTLLIIVIIAISSYYLIFNKLICFQ